MNNNKRKDKDPLFAEVNLMGDEFKQSPSTNMQRTRFLKQIQCCNPVPAYKSFWNLQRSRIYPGPKVLINF